MTLPLGTPRDLISSTQAIAAAPAPLQTIFAVFSSLRSDAGVDEARCGNDGRAVLIVVEDGNIHQLPQALLDDEAVRRPDVLEVDAAKEGPR